MDSLPLNFGDPEEDTASFPNWLLGACAHWPPAPREGLSPQLFIADSLPDPTTLQAILTTSSPGISTAAPHITTSVCLPAVASNPQH